MAYDAAHGVANGIAHGVAHGVTHGVAHGAAIGGPEPRPHCQALSQQAAEPLADNKAAIAEPDSAAHDCISHGETDRVAHRQADQPAAALRAALCGAKQAPHEKTFGDQVAQ